MLSTSFADSAEPYVLFGSTMLSATCDRSARARDFRRARRGRTGIRHLDRHHPRPIV